MKVHRNARPGGRASILTQALTMLAVLALLAAACSSTDDADDAADDETGTEQEATEVEPSEDPEVATEEETAQAEPTAEEPTEDEPTEVAAADEDCTEASGDPVTVGVNYPDSAAVALPELLASAEAAASYANDCLGGLAGAPIELLTCPTDEANPATVVECANTFVEAGVVTVVSTITGAGAAMVPIVQGAGIPYITTSGNSAEETTDTSGLVFALGGGAAGTLGAMALRAAEQGISRVGIVLADIGVAGLTPLAEATFGAAGVEFEIAGVPVDAADPSTQVNSLLSNGAEALAVVGSGPLCASFVGTVAAVDPGGNHWGIGTCTAPQLIQAVGAEAYEGFVQFNTVSGTGDSAATEEYLEVMETYAPDTDPGGFAAFGYAAMLGLVRGAQDADAPTPEALGAAMAATDGVELPAGGGATFSCADPPFPFLPSVCGSANVVSTITDGEPQGSEVYDAAELFGG